MHTNSDRRQAVLLVELTRVLTQQTFGAEMIRYEMPR